LNSLVNSESKSYKDKAIYRQKDEILADILYSAQGGTGITKTMFRAYLTHNQAKGYT